MRSLGSALVALHVIGILASAPARADSSTPAPVARAANPTLEPARALVQRLKKHGRAEVTIERRVFDPLAGRPESVPGELVLEPPDRLSLFFPESGERLTVRSDGGEWLQPRLKQMLRLGAARAAAARRWWGIFFPDRAGGVAARRAGSDRFLLIAGGEPAAAETAWVTLDREGLPARLEIDEGGEEPTLYRLRGWRFRRPRGPAAFVLRAPAEFQVVDLP